MNTETANAQGPLPPAADAASRYPALMAYIMDRGMLEKAGDWCAKMREDESLARSGDETMGRVASELAKAQADYAASRAPGANTYPYNAAMGAFLGLPLKANNEPTHGYYMASGVMDYYRLGAAEREAAALIAEGRPLRIVTARCKKDRKPVRFATFTGPEQIKIDGGSVVATNGKKGFRLSSNWSAETCLQNVVAALRSGHAYGEAA